MPGTVSPANYLWLLRSQTLGEPTTATFLNQCNSQLHCKHPSLYPQIHAAPTPHPWSLIAVDKRPTEPQLVIRETRDWGGRTQLVDLSRNPSLKAQETSKKGSGTTLRATGLRCLLQDKCLPYNRSCRQGISHVATQTRPTRQREHQSTFQCRWVDRGNSRDTPPPPSLATKRGELVFSRDNLW